MDFPKRSIQEIVFLCSQHPDYLYGSIFVEGGGDKRLMDLYLGKRGGFFRPIYSMDTIDFSGVDFSSMGLSKSSSRSAVIALRKILREQGVSVERATFLVDRDQEDFVPTNHMDGIELTDAGALPVHIFDNRVEENIAVIVAKGAISYQDLKNSVVEICRVIYCLRVVNSKIDCGLKFIAPSADIFRSNSGVYSINVQSYLYKCWRAGRCEISLDEIYDNYVSVYDGVFSSGIPGYRLINDHDLWRVLKFILDDVSGGDRRSEKDVEDLVVSNFDSERLSLHRLFAAIEGAVNAASR